MIQIASQMRTLVAVDSVDFRRGMDGLAALCTQAFKADPLSGTVFVFRSRSGKALRCLTYDGQGYWLAQNAHNSRYLILPWVRIAQLASHLLARIARRLSADWQELYHHPIHLLESFVDIERFQGTCYRAANWQCLGRSLGRGTKSKHDAPDTSVKELWVYPLSQRLKERLLTH